MEDNQKKNKNIIAILIGLLALTIGANVFQLLNKPKTVQEASNSNNVEIDTELEEANLMIQQMTAEKNLALDQVDSLEIAVSEWKLEVERIKNESKLGNISADERNRLLGEISALKSRILMFSQKEKQIDSLTNTNVVYQNKIQTQTKTINNLEGKVNELSTNLEGVSKTNTELNNKLSTATKIQFSNITAMGIDNKKGSIRNTFDASKLDELAIEFKLIGNALYNKTTTEEIKVRVLGPNGILYQQAGTILEKPRQEDFTFLESISYNGKASYFKHSFKPTKRMAKGNYEVELFQNDAFVQKSTFTLY